MQLPTLSSERCFWIKNDSVSSCSTVIEYSGVSRGKIKRNIRCCIINAFLGLKLLDIVFDRSEEFSEDSVNIIFVNPGKNILGNIIHQAKTETIMPSQICVGTWL